MNEFKLLVACIFAFGFGALFLIGGPGNVIDGIKGLKEFFTGKTQEGEIKPLVSFEFLILLGFVFLFGALWISSFFIVPWALYTIAQQVEPFGLIVAIGLFIWLLLGIGQELRSKYKNKIESISDKTK